MSSVEDRPDGGDGSGDRGAEVRSGLERRLRREHALGRRFEQVLSRRLQLAVPKPSPKLRGDPPAAFALTLKRVDRWPVHIELLKRVAADQHSLEYSVHLSFFHRPTRSFFGSTWEGKPCPADPQDGEDRTVHVSIQDVVFWYSYIDDPDTLAVLELVATEFDRGKRIRLGQYACGWTYLNPTPFGRRDMLDVRDDKENLFDGDAFRRLPVFKRSPRVLAFLTDREFGQLEDTAFPDTTLEYRLLQHQALLSARHLIFENELVGPTDVIPGLRRCLVELPNQDPQRMRALGAEVVFRQGGDFGRRSDSAVRPHRHVRLASTWLLEVEPQLLRVNERRLPVVHVEGLPEFEDLLSQGLSRARGNNLQTHDEMLAAYSRRSGVPVQNLAVRSLGWKVKERRLRFGLHNGRQFTMCHVSRAMIKSDSVLKSVPLALGDRDDELVVARDLDAEEGVLELPGLSRSPLFALVALLEFEVRPEQDVIVEVPHALDTSEDASAAATRRMEASAVKAAKTLKVVVGAGSLVPWDGRRLRLRTARMHANQVDLRMQSDPTLARLLASQMPEADRPVVWPPPGSDPRLEEDFPKSVRFTLRAYERDRRGAKTRQVPDETPDELDEVDYEDEDERDDGSGDEDFEESEYDDRSSVSSHRPRRTPRPKKRVSSPVSARTESEPSSPSLSSLPSARTPRTEDDRLYSSAPLVPGPMPRRLRHQPSSDLDGWLADRDEEWGGWNEGAHIPRDRSSLLKHTLQAPVHAASPTMGAPPMFEFGGGGGGGGGATRVNYVPVPSVAVGGPVPLPTELTRASRARLNRHGFATMAAKDPRQQVAGELGYGAADGLGIKASIDLEMCDTRARNDICFQFVAYRAPGRHDPLPASVYFSYHFFDRQPLRSARALLHAEKSGANDRPRILVGDGSTGGRGRRDDGPISETVVVDTSGMSVAEAREFFDYLLSRVLYVDVWDGDSQIQLGTVAIALHQLLRQGKGMCKKTLEYPVVRPFGAVDDSETVSVAGHSVAAGEVVGYLQLVLANYGEQGRHGDRPAEGAPKDSVVRGNEDHAPSGMNWRFANQQSADPELDGAAGGGLGASNPQPSQTGSKRGRNRPAHRKRARPLSQVSGEVEELLTAPRGQLTGGVVVGGNGGGGGAQGRPALPGNDPNTVTYDELVLLAKRFRESGQPGRVRYTGKLMQLLDVPNLDSKEKQCVSEIFRRLSAAGRSLEDLAGSLDRSNERRIRTEDLKRLFAGLLVRTSSDDPQQERPLLRERELAMLASRVDYDGDGWVGTGEFVAWVNARRRTSTVAEVQLRLRKVLAEVELRERVNVDDELAALWRVGNGPFVDRGALVKKLAVLDRRSVVESEDLDRFLDHVAAESPVAPPASGKAVVHLPTFAERLGRTLPANEDELLAHVKHVLSRVGNLDLAFARWDRDGTGEISLNELQAGLESVGLFEHAKMDSAAARKVLAAIGQTGDLKVSLRDLHEFVGHDFDAHLADRVRRTLNKAEKAGTSIESIFRVWDKQRQGSIDQEELLQGLLELSTSLFANIKSSDVRRLISTIAGGTDCAVTLKGLMAFAGSDFIEFVAATLRRVVRHAEEHQDLTVSELFRDWDSDRSGELTLDQLELGMHNLGMFDQLQREDVRPLLEQMDGDEHRGRVRVHDFARFMGRDCPSYLAVRLKKLCEKAKVPAEQALAELDPSGEGMITKADLTAALQKLQGFDDVTAGEVDDVVSGVGTDEQGRVSLTVLARSLSHGMQPEVAERNFSAALRKAKQLGWRVADFFDTIDYANDGEVALDLFHTSLMKEFTALARHADGQDASLELTRNEVEYVCRRFESHDGNLRVARTKFADYLVEHDLCSRQEADAAAERAAAKKAQAQAMTPRLDDLQKRDAAAASATTDIPRRLDSQADDSEAENPAADWTDGHVLAEASPEEYEFSLDPDTRAIELKLRRVAQSYQANTERHGLGGADVEGLFKAFDRARTGAVLRAEFVNVLMQLGLSLLDEPEGPAGGGEMSGERGEALRRRRMAQLSRVKGHPKERSAKLRTRQPLLFKPASSDYHDEEGRPASSLAEQGEDLALIKWYREGHKKTMVRQIIMSGIKSEVHVYPRFGQMLFFEHPLRNPFNAAERFEVQISSRRGGVVAEDASTGGLRIVDNAEQWEYLRRHVYPAVGTLSERGAESDMLDMDASSGAQLMVLAHETVHIPFKYLSETPPESRGRPGDEDHTVTVRFVSTGHGHVVAILEVHVHPRPPVVHRTLRFLQNEDSIVKRCVRLLHPAATHGAARGGGGGTVFGAVGEALARGQRFSSKHVVCVDMGQRNVLVESREGADGVQEVFFKFWKLGPFPSRGHFFVLVYDDPFRARMHEVWHITVASRLRKDVQATLGQAANVELTVVGDNQRRRVRAYASEELEVLFNPSSIFQLTPRMMNQFALRWTPHGQPGTRKSHVHLVDVDTKELVCAWILTAVASPPQVTKDYEVEVRVGEASHKRISYENPWNRRRTWVLRSTNPNLVRPKNDEVTIEPRGRAFLRLYLAPIDRRGVVECFVMVNDESDQNEECFRITVTAV